MKARQLVMKFQGKTKTILSLIKFSASYELSLHWSVYLLAYSFHFRHSSKRAENREQLIMRITHSTGFLSLDLKEYKKELENIASQWNGKESGREEDRATTANEAIEKIDSLLETLKEIK